MGLVEVSGLSYALPGGRTLFDDVSLRVGAGEHVALIGANGSGKTTLLRLLCDEERAPVGSVRIEGRSRFMRQLMGSTTDDGTVRELLLSLSPAPLRRAAKELDDATRAAQDEPGERSGMRVARAHAGWGDAGGYEAEVLWDVCATAALGCSFDAVADRMRSTLSGGEQKRLALEVLLRCDAEVLLLDEPDNFLDVPAKEWLEDELTRCPKTVLFVSHDRELLARTATKIITLEGRVAWTHPSSFATYRAARSERLDRIDEEHRRYTEERVRLEASLREFRRRAQMGSDTFASRVRATKTKIERFERGAPPERAREQHISMRLGGDRTGKRAVAIEGLEIAGLTDPFDTEILFGERIGVIGHNGTGKSHFLKLLAGHPIAHGGEFMLGARVVPGYFSQVHEQLETPASVLLEHLQEKGRTRGEAMAALRRYELHDAWNQPLATLSGGQQARFQILLLELSGATLLLLDEPTDNLDLASADALEAALAQFQGTALIVTHDRWLMRGCDRFLVFGRDCTVRETLEPVYR
ncbi:MAG: transporter ATP-binding protein [Actinomycetia bacterium]|nr:transporter ATP-binding protein [Actinomycetes bacterium]